MVISMEITVKCFATLAQFLPENSDNYPIELGDTVADIVSRLGMKEEDINLIFVNSARAFMDTGLNDGDRLGLFPAVGGG